MSLASCRPAPGEKLCVGDRESPPEGRVAAAHHLAWGLTGADVLEHALERRPVAAFGLLQHLGQHRHAGREQLTGERRWAQHRGLSTGDTWPLAGHG